ncbi:MAG TPA: DUF3037 domain-containing protein [Cyanobacteria bacterium UBA12227]|nr:DUF3037 domain-containing protein [Cyanobacteria bacterium UBA12227]HAX86332.1 DUF3037 domain-containing protein [Cyanobacteria bacterium UBA11370]HBY76615.1 DUF3037 domain-containing protein [Cyanobacteria bacterium UBA11148]
MASKYSIVQYVPNPIADERINIGVVAFDDNRVCVRFLTNWDRVSKFGGEDINFLKDFARRMNEASELGLLVPGEQSDDTPKHERLRKIARGWINSIQFTEPRDSLDNVDSLVADIAQTCLVEPTTQKPKVRDRKAAARVAISAIRKVIKRDFPDEAKDLLKTNYQIQGSRTQHEFDVVVSNGKPYFAAHGISFEVQVPQTLQDSVSWRISDVKKYDPNFPIAIILLPPRSDNSDREQLDHIYQQNTTTYRELGASVITEHEVERWVSERLASLSI